MTDSILHLELRIPPEWERIESVRLAVGRCLAAITADTNLEGDLAMVSAELLENAVKYGTPKKAVRILIRAENSDVVVSVSNAVQNSRHLEKLQRRINWLREFSDPSAAYAAALEEVYDQASDANFSEGGLGIVRVAYEGGCDVALETSRPGELVVSARRAGALTER